MAKEIRRDRGWSRLGRTSLAGGLGAARRGRALDTTSSRAKVWCQTQALVHRGPYQWPGSIFLGRLLDHVDHPEENTGQKTQNAPYGTVGNGKANGFSKGDSTVEQIDQDVDQGHGKEAKASPTCGPEEGPSHIGICVHEHVLPVGFIFHAKRRFSR